MFCDSHNVTPVKNWFKEQELFKEKVKKLHF